MKERDNMFAKLERKYEYRFAFCNGDEDPMDGTDLTRNSAYGSTTMDMKNGQRRLITFLNLKHFAPLIFEQALTDAERMGLQWHIAGTLVHEIMASKSNTILS